MTTENREPSAGGDCTQTAYASTVKVNPVLDEVVSEGVAADRKRMGPAGLEGWVIGARVMNASGVESIIRSMRNGYIQCSRPDSSDVGNYRRKELQLIEDLSSDDDDGLSEVPGAGPEGLFSTMGPSDEERTSEGAFSAESNDEEDWFQGRCFCGDVHECWVVHGRDIEVALSAAAITAA